MKKYLTDWRIWLIVVQICAVLVCVMAEPDENGSFCPFVCALIASKLLGVLLAIGVFYELKLWRNRFEFIEKLFDEEEK